MTLPAPDGPLPHFPPPPPPARQIPPGRIAMLVILGLVVTALITVAVIALSGGFSGPATFTLRGSLTLVPSTVIDDVSFGAGKEAATGNTCVMPFEVPDVPLGLASYSVTISHRGTQVESPSDAHAGVQLTIGGN